jgi:hypothetical protein
MTDQQEIPDEVVDEFISRARQLHAGGANTADLARELHITVDLRSVRVR